MTRKLLFDEESHIYTVQEGMTGIIIPSVSQVLQKNGMYGYPKTGLSRMKMLYGTEVHKYTVLIDRQMMDASEVSEFPELFSYEKFIQETSFVAGLIESRHFHPSYLYAGTIDRHGFLKLGSEVSSVVIDIKTGYPHPATDIQLAAYRELITANGFRVDKTFALYLGREGDYKLVEGRDHEKNWKLFLSALSLLRWKEVNRIGTDN